MQLQSDVLNTEVQRPVVTEVTTLGAAYLAGLAVGFWGSIDELKHKSVLDRSFQPCADEMVNVNVVILAGSARLNVPKGWVTE